MSPNALSETELARATLAELFERSERGVRLHCLGSLATAVGGFGIVASLDGSPGRWERIAIWAALVIASTAVLYWALVVRRVIPASAATVDRTLVVCAANGLLVGSIGWFDLEGMRNEAFAYALCSATLAYCAGALVSLHHGLRRSSNSSLRLTERSIRRNL